MDSETEVRRTRLGAQPWGFGNPSVVFEHSLLEMCCMILF